jgi:CobQ-like glutamine amidotransferase family enzyme
MARDSEIRIGLVLPDVLGTYGDNGNAVVLRRRLEWRGIDARIVPLGLDDAVPDSLDVYLIGGGEDSAQSLGSQYLARQAGLRRACDRGAPVLAVCAGLQVLGHWFTGSDGSQRPGLGLLDLVTAPAEHRAVGEMVTEPLGDLLTQQLTGFENHQGHTTLGGGARPLAKVVRGIGNDEQADGAVAGHVIATYLHGPVLARNPELADLLLAWAVGAPLQPLDVPAVDLLRKHRLAGHEHRSGTRHGPRIPGLTH